MPFNTCSRHVHQNLISLAEWTSVLKLSHFFGMEALQSLATSKIMGLPETREEWFSILEFSASISNLPIPEIREAAVRAISGLCQLPPIEKIVLARQNGIKEWLIEGYVSLVSGDRLPEDIEDRLGAEATYQLLRMRDRSDWRCTCTGRRPAGAGKLFAAKHRCVVDPGPLRYIWDIRKKVCSRFAKEIETVGDVANLTVISSPQLPDTDQLIHHSERGISRDETFYFETETITVSDFHGLPGAIVS
jgi:hypothetical protein